MKNALNNDPISNGCICILPSIIQSSGRYTLSWSEKKMIIQQQVQYGETMGF